MKSHEPGVNSLNWNLLRSFYAIAEERSITKAAQRLNMRQPSLSLALQRLEEELGCQLVHRDSRHFELTARGSRVFNECEEIYRGVARVKELTKGDCDETSGLLRLNIVSNLHSPIIDEAIRLLHQRSPSITWQLEVANSGDIVRSIAQEQISIGICLLTKPVVTLNCRMLFREEFAIFCGNEHPLFGAKNVVLQELQHEPFVSFTCAVEGLGLEPVAVLREGAGLGSRVAGSSSNLEEVRRMIIAGLGVGVLPVAATRNEIEKGQLWPLPVANGGIGADVFLITNPNVQLRPVEERFIDVIDELMQIEEKTPSAAL